MLFQPRWPEKTGNSEPAGAIDLSHRPSMVPGRFFLPPFVCGGLFPLFISVHWCAIATATKWNNCFFLVPDAVGGGLLPSAASADTTATAAAMGIVCCGRGSRSGPRGPTRMPGTNCSCASGILAYVCMQFAENDFSSSSKVQPTPGS